MLTLVTGGARSGKSRVAERLAELAGSPVTYLATATTVAPDGEADAEMVERIARHRDGRPADWTTVEAPLELTAAIAAASPNDVVLVDCLTVWLGNVMFEADPDDGALRERYLEVAEAAAARPHPTILVTNEVGGGLVPMDPLGRRYRDHHGWMNQAVADRAERVLLCAAGRVLELGRLDDVLGLTRAGDV